MNWLKRKIRNWLASEYVTQKADHAISMDTTSPQIRIEGLMFNVMPAQGGTIVQIRHYNRRKDENDYITHIITEQEDVSERIGHIVSMELMRAL